MRSDDVTTNSRMTRRAFVQRGAMLVAAMPALRWRAFGRRAPIALRVGIVTAPGENPSASDLALGIRLGIDEASHSAALFGGSVISVPVTPSTLASAHVAAIVGGDAQSCGPLARAAESTGVIFMNARCTSDALRGSDCRPTTFHVVPSDAMYRDALTRGKAPQGAIAAAWDASLERFGADTLNGRFRARFGRGMSADAWLGWMAIKVLWESALRARSTDARALIDYLTHEVTQFDGHKGVPLSFRTWDHQLRQPVYIVSVDKDHQRRVIAEVPTSIPDETSSRDALDRLGTSATQSTCRTPQ